MRSQLGFRSALVALATIGAYAAPAWAYLGSFTANDGYYVQSGQIFGDVSYYNAGQSGPNAGGGGYVQIPKDTGLWTLNTPVGGYFATVADRNAATSAAPPYPFSPVPNALGAYIVGGHGGGRTFDTCLALRNDTPLGTGPMMYDYDLDTYNSGEHHHGRGARAVLLLPQPGRQHATRL